MLAPTPNMMRIGSPHSWLLCLIGEEAAVVLRGYFNTTDVKAAFMRCDKNGDKSLDVTEVQRILRHSMAASCGPNPNPDCDRNPNPDPDPNERSRSF